MWPHVPSIRVSVIAITVGESPRLAIRLYQTREPIISCTANPYARTDVTEADGAAEILRRTASPHHHASFRPNQ